MGVGGAGVQESGELVPVIAGSQLPGHGGVICSVGLGPCSGRGDSCSWGLVVLDEAGLGLQLEPVGRPSLRASYCGLFASVVGLVGDSKVLSPLGCGACIKQNRYLVETGSLGGFGFLITNQ